MPSPWKHLDIGSILIETPWNSHHSQSETHCLHRNTLSYEGGKILGLRIRPWHWPHIIWPVLDRTSELVSAYHQPLSPPITFPCRGHLSVSNLVEALLKSPQLGYFDICRQGIQWHFGFLKKAFVSSSLSLVGCNSCDNYCYRYFLTKFFSSSWPLIFCLDLG